MALTLVRFAQDHGATPEGAVVELDEAEAERLIALGVARRLAAGEPSAPLPSGPAIRLKMIQPYKLNLPHDICTFPESEAAELIAIGVAMPAPLPPE